MPRILRLALLGLLTSVALVPELRAADVAKDARAVLEKYCAECHGPRGGAKGGFDYVLDRERLVARGQVTPAKADDSPLLQRVRDGDMPPGKRGKPTAAELALLNKWIADGAAAFSVAANAAAPREYAPLHKIMLDDLNTLDSRSRRFTRYLTLNQLAGSGISADDLDKHRHALTKLVNSLSWHPRLRRLQPVDAAATVFRLDLRDYKWNARTWDKLASIYPYRLPESSDTSRSLTALTSCEQPYLRGDWFADTASRPPFYFDFLQMPGTDRGLERLLQVDVPANQQDDSAVRVGFNGSGVARGNRVLERHDAIHGSYWRSYDFNDNISRQNIFEHPVSFQAAGGEIIFNLPNGLQCYLLVDSAGRRVDKAPGEIVSDPKRPDKLVETGVSCMSCHVRGILPKDDQVRAHILKNPAPFTKTERESALALYAPAARMRALIKEDSERFMAALTKIGVPITDQDPIEVAVLRYEGTLDLSAAAAETGLTPEAFSMELRKSSALSRSLGALLASGGVVQRQLFEESFPELARMLKLGRDNATDVAIARAPFVGHRGSIRALAISDDGKRAATGGEDRIVRVWDLDTGKELAALEGHTDEIETIAFMPDGRRVVSGSADRSIRLWDITEVKESGRLMGHTEGVRSLVVTKDGHRVASAGSDRTVRIWNIDTQKEIRSLTGYNSAVTCLVLSPDGNRLLTGSLDRSLRLWDVKTWAPLSRWEGHDGAILSVAFSADGKQAVSGGSDRTIRLWDVAKGKELRKMTGHHNAVVRVAFLPDGRVVSASSRYQTDDAIIRIWDPQTAKEVKSFEVAGLERVENVVFLPDGSKAFISHASGSLRLWALPKQVVK